MLGFSQPKIRKEPKNRKKEYRPGKFFSTKITQEGFIAIRAENTNSIYSYFD